jgi:hypothetical protein
MSLLDDASLLVTPNAEKAGKLYSIIPTNGNGDFSVTRATTATRTNSSGLIESVPINEPRLDYSLGSCPNILLEPQRTNLALRSEEFDNATWTKTAVSVTANSTTSPSGIQNADTMTGDGTSSLHGLEQSISVTSGVTYSWSIYAKKNTNNFLQIHASSGRFGSNVWANFDLNNGTLGSIGSSTTASIQSVGNGWYRCTMTATATATGSAATYITNLITSSTSLRGETNTLSTSVFLCDAQLEAGANATSYIPTSSASVTRNADIVQATGVSSLIGQTEGVLFVDFNFTKATDVYRRVFAISDNTSNNLISINLTATGSAEIYIINGGVTQVAFANNILSVNARYKIAVGYIANNAVLYINGVLRNTDLNCTIPTCSGVYLGKVETAGSTAFLNDTINSAALFKTRLTNTQLAALTA